jgi:4-hydroxybenzoate polyprenyltransferase
MLPLVKLLRPRQWTKNLACLAGVVFGDRLSQHGDIAKSIVVTGLFCAISSASYIFNDIYDCDRDRLHPQKKMRQIPSGQVGVSTAWIVAIVLGIPALGGSFYFGWATFACFALFMMINVAYTLWLKHEVVLDVCSIAFGYVLRLLAGVYALHDTPTAWITLCTLFLAMFLAFCKRRAEFASTANQEMNYRPVLAQYNLAFLDMLINGSATMTVLSYALFTATSGKNPTLVVTVPIVYYAVMHYKFLVLVRNIGQEPEQILLQDSRIRLSILLWLTCYLGIFYGKLHLFR